MSYATSRTRPRYEAYLDATIQSGCVTGPGTVLTLSEAGLFVATKMAFGVGSRLRIGFEVPDFSPVDVSGVVIYRAIHHDRSGFGIRFLSAESGGVESIRRWYEEFSLPH